MENSSQEEQVETSLSSSPASSSTILEEHDENQSKKQQQKHGKNNFLNSIKSPDIFSHIEENIEELAQLYAESEQENDDEEEKEETNTPNGPNLEKPKFPANDSSSTRNLIETMVVLLKSPSEKLQLRAITSIKVDWNWRGK